MITQITRKQFFGVTDVRAIGNFNSRTVDVCNQRVHRKYLMKAPDCTKEFLPESHVPDVLCNWEINSKMEKVCV